VFGRLGGEEFGVLLPRTSAPEAVALLEDLRGRLEARHVARLPPDIAYTFSVGVDQHRAGESLSVLMARVDAALYEAKAAGRNRVMAAF
jgi:diguanylate cyclase (GGDEF)-like protein